MTEYRIEKDSMGEVKVPAQAYYGAQTQRAVANFPISGMHLPKKLIHALGLVKVAAATGNHGINASLWRVQYSTTSSCFLSPMLY